MARFGIWLAFPCAVVLLLPAAAYNRFPLFYPDSVAYLHYGDRLVRLAVPIVDRAIYYGLAIWPFHLELSLWPVVVAQALILAHLLRVLLRCLDLPSGVLPWLGLVAILSGLTSVSWYVSQIMPDIFAGILVPALFLTAFCRDRLTRAERVWFPILIVLSIMLHPTHLAIAAVLGALAWLLWCVRPSRPAAMSAAILTAAPAIGFALSMAGSIALFDQARLTPDGAPYFLGRLIADGPGLNYLRESCAKGARYELCREVDNFPRETWQVLWDPNSPLRTHAGFRAEVMEEADAIVRGTILMFPGQVLSNAWDAFQRQFVTIDSELVMGPSRELVAVWNPYAAAGFAASWQAHGLATSGRMARFNKVHRPIYLGSIALMLAATPWLWHRRRRWMLLLIAMTTVALVVNAALTGVVSDVVGRYQGRVAWLPTLMVLLCAATAWRNGFFADDDKEKNFDCQWE